MGKTLVLPATGAPVGTTGVVRNGPQYMDGTEEGGTNLALVTALRRAHDATEAPVLWPTPQEALEELRTNKRRGDSRDNPVT